MSWAEVSEVFAEFAESWVAESPRDSESAEFEDIAASPYNCNWKNLTVADSHFAMVVVATVDHNNNFAESAESRVADSYTQYWFDY